MFEDLMRDVHASFTERFLKIQITAEPPRAPAPPPPAATAPRRPPAPSAGADDMFAPDAREAPVAPPAVGPRLPAPPPVTTNRGPLAPARAATGTAAEVGRNDPCPCGSGKKYKKCHGVGK